MKQPVAMHELLGPKITSERRILINRYQRALELFEAGEINSAFEELSSLTTDYDNDQVTEFLLAHCSKLVTGELDSINRSSTKEAIYPLARGLLIPASSPAESNPPSAAPNDLKKAKG